MATDEHEGLARSADGVWIAAMPLESFGIQYGARMTVVRLAAGSLLRSGAKRIFERGYAWALQQSTR